MGVTAMELLAAGECTPSCLLAMTSLIEGCQCRCEGRWHATLLWEEPAEWSGPSAFDRPVEAASHPTG